MQLDVVILDVCNKELRSFPKEVLEDFLDAVAKLRLGQNLSLPLSRPMPDSGKGVHELRFKDRAGIYRVFYFIKKKEAIYVVHAFQKKTQKTPRKILDLVKKRVRRLK